jgi:cell division initiation protein
MAQQTSEEVKKNAYEKADNILKEAEIKAQKIINEATQEVVKVNFEYEDMKKRLYIFKSKAETLLMSQLEVMKQMFEET